MKSVPNKVDYKLHYLMWITLVSLYQDLMSRWWCGRTLNLPCVLSGVDIISARPALCSTTASPSAATSATNKPTASSTQPKVTNAPAQTAQGAQFFFYKGATLLREANGSQFSVTSQKSWSCITAKKRIQLWLPWPYFFLFLLLSQELMMKMQKHQSAADQPPSDEDD